MEGRGYSARGAPTSPLGPICLAEGANCPRGWPSCACCARFVAPSCSPRHRALCMQGLAGEAGREEAVREGAVQASPPGLYRGQAGELGREAAFRGEAVSPCCSPNADCFFAGEPSSRGLDSPAAACVASFGSWALPSPSPRHESLGAGPCATRGTGCGTALRRSTPAACSTASTPPQYCTASSAPSSDVTYSTCSAF